ncbi:hypothetical protein AJ79_09448 [Helicocarpus griseus UAMH5409]|uniref:Protein BNI4 n=1 Tax=Helicocarpus griseus UAMH5409 TaxID=1447875 RepID=A0A2B7WBA1_9EURO|nr:hypothetical protein AJ79_09448 [Helicocarpus griseus UAMH5409]
MAALVQTIPQQTSTITLLQPRPSSSAGSFPSSQPTPQQHPQMARNQQASRASHNNGGGNGTGYRTSQAGQPVAPYAFTSTPSLTTGNPHARQNTPPLLKTEHRAVSAPSAPQVQTNPTFPGVIPQRAHFTTAGSVSSSSPISSTNSHGSKDDSAIPSRQRAGDPASRPLSSLGFTPPSFSAASPSASKPSPDRYRRGQRRVEQASQGQNGIANVSPSVLNGSHLNFAPNAKNVPFPHHSRGASADDAFIDKPQSPELAKRYRRRSLGSLDTTGLMNFSQSKPASEATVSLSTQNSSMPDRQRPHSAHTYSHAHKGSSESVTSTRSSPPPGKRTSSSTSSPTTLKLDNKPLENPKRVTNPSPLSQPLNMSPGSSKTKPASNSMAEPSGPTQEEHSSPTPPKIQSPAAKRLTELSKKGFNKSGKSRLRRALSFGSAAELRASAAPESPPLAGRPGQEVSRKQQLDEELGAEQAAIAEKQEANGLGESIYSGQGHIFSGSMDNLSISSTASSASVMLRKMGKGMRRSTRSLVGLFRPKSALNAPGDSTPAEPMTPQVSIVNVEAERDNAKKTNTTTSEQDKNGPLGAPAQERTSVDTGSTGTGDQSNADTARKSIMGGEKERAEVLAAVRKGILKRTGTGSNTSSPVVRPVEPRGTDVTTPNIPHIHDSPHSSAPSTPGEDRPPRSGHRRTDSITIEGEDYFLPGGRYTTNAASAPVTPQALIARNISFSPRIQFHDTWPSGEYDRRGEIATCNRLTPLLAQQIKEELNTFKMEMEVHESSKVYTHFF